jgi:hypothetical protein
MQHLVECSTSRIQILMVTCISQTPRLTLFWYHFTLTLVFTRFSDRSFSYTFLSFTWQTSDKRNSCKGRNQAIILLVQLNAFILFPLEFPYSSFDMELKKMLNAKQNAVILTMQLYFNPSTVKMLSNLKVLIFLVFLCSHA